MKNEFPDGSGSAYSPHTFDLTSRTVHTLFEIPSIIISSGKAPDAVIHECLAVIGSILGATRAFVMVNEKDDRYLRNTHEWVNEKIGAPTSSWQLYDYEYDIPSLKGILAENSVVIAQVDQLPPDMQLVLQKQGVKTVIWSAMIRNGSIIGLVGVDFCDGSREFPPEYTSVLKYIAAAINLTLERKEMQAMRNKLTAIQDIIIHAAPLPIRTSGAAGDQGGKPMTLLDAERRIIIETLELYKGNKLKTARHLGLTWPSLDRRCKKLGIESKKR